MSREQSIEQQVEVYFQREGWAKTMNPHGMVGQVCGCGTCFCCYALKRVRQYHEDERQKLESKP